VAGDPHGRAGAVVTASREALLAVALRAALAAGEAILKVYAAEFAVYEKSDATPVTEADLAAERIIVAMLKEAFPDIPIVSEELVEAGGLPPAAARFWAVDPLDGTKEFVARNGEFAVNIGLVEDGRPVLGVVHGPALGVTYAACGPGTATRRFGGGRPEPIAARSAPAEGLVVVHSRSHENSRRLAEFLRAYPVRARRSCGSALKFGLLAAGEADLYPRFGTTMEWDTAAGQAVLESAGGRVETLAGTPLLYGKPGLKNDGFLAWGRRASPRAAAAPPASSRPAGGIGGSG
jgi:3'(2'), 5'-bisphosphate nucleotidase